MYAHVVEFNDSFGVEWQVTIYKGEPTEFCGCVLHAFESCRYFTNVKAMRAFLREKGVKVTSKEVVNDRS